MYRSLSILLASSLLVAAATPNTVTIIPQLHSARGDGAEQTASVMTSQAYIEETLLTMTDKSSINVFVEGLTVESEVFIRNIGAMCSGKVAPEIFLRATKNFSDMAEPIYSYYVTRSETSKQAVYFTGGGAYIAFCQKPGKISILPGEDRNLHKQSIQAINLTSTITSETSRVAFNKASELGIGEIFEREFRKPRRVAREDTMGDHLIALAENVSTQEIKTILLSGAERIRNEVDPHVFDAREVYVLSVAAQAKNPVVIFGRGHLFTSPSSSLGINVLRLPERRT